MNNRGRRGIPRDDQPGSGRLSSPYRETTLGDTRPSSCRAADTVTARPLTVSSNADTAPADHTGKWLRPPLPRFHGRYLLERRIGVGGMGTVYAGSKAGGGPTVAVKVLSAHLTGPEGAERFRREIEALRHLDHPNVVRLLDHGYADARPFYVMDLVDGPDLTNLIRLDGPQPPGRVCTILRQLASALVYAHAQGIVHRDIKPSNIILGWDEVSGEVAKLLDFGLVLPRDRFGERLTSEDMLLGTPGYIAPEGAQSSHRLGPRSDLYALAMIAFHLRTGRHLFRPVDAVCEESHRAALGRGWRVLRGAGGLPDPVERAMWRSLRFDPARRPDSAVELLSVLDALEDPPSWPHDEAASWWAAHRARGEDATERPQAASIRPQLKAR